MVRFHLPTMSCGGCLNAVTRAIRQRDPGAAIEADLARREIALRSDLPESTLLGALCEAGYPAEPVAQPSPQHRA